jgi:hypothetical protein
LIRSPTCAFSFQHPPHLIVCFVCDLSRNPCRVLRGAPTPDS